MPISQFLGANPTTTQVGLGGIIKTIGGFGTGATGRSNLTYVGANEGEKATRPTWALWAIVLGVGLIGVLH